jgi:hypothetical protein
MYRLLLVTSAVLVAVAAVGTTSAAQVPVPQLISPEEGAILDNGRRDGSDPILWDFDWSDCQGTTAYHLYVIGANASIPVIDDPALTESSFHFTSQGYIADINRFDWRWKVRAQVDGVWGDWSPERTFDVEPVDTDPTGDPSVPVPELISPAEGAVLDNGRTDRLNLEVWDFDWSDCPGATHYHLYVQHQGAPNPVINRSDLTQSSYHMATLGSYVADLNRFDWTWKVRAEVGGVWGCYSPERTFEVEPVNTDPPNVFADLPDDHWALGEIMAAYLADIVAGYPDGTYQPANPVGRDQMAVYISRAMAGGDSNVPGFTETPTFTDVPAGNWALKYVEYAVSHDVVQGYDATHYVPDAVVDRGQMAVFVARSQGWVSLGDDMTTAPEVFPDIPAGFWAGTAVKACVDHGVVQGYLDGLYHPDDSVTRDQMAVYISRAFELPM